MTGKLMSHQPQMELNIPEHYGLAGFGDLSVPEDVAQYIAGKICRTTVDKPIKAKELCELVKERFFTSITTPTIRSVVSHCRRNLRFPIASERGGYFLALKADELDKTLRHLHRRIVCLQAVFAEIETVQKFKRERERRLAGEA